MGGERKTTSTWLWVNLKIGALSFGSASRVTLYEDELVTKRAWLSGDEFGEALTLAQILPGPNLINLSACLGFRLVGVWVTLFGLLLLALPGAVLAVLVAVWVPLDNPAVATLFRGFAIGALMLLGRLLWGLLLGISRGTTVPRRKNLGRYLLATLLMLALSFQAPVMVVIACGVLGGLAWEFLL